MSLNAWRIGLRASAFVPTWQWDFSRKLAMPAGVTFTRASAATCFDSAGVLRAASSNVARFDYDPVTLRSLGYLTECASTNLNTYSELFSNGSWNKSRSSVTANAATAPDGTSNAMKLTEDSTASNTHQLYQNYSVTSGTIYTISIFAKAGERTWLNLQFFGSGFTSGGAWFDLANGLVGTVNGSVFAQIRPVGNGWYRCSAYSTAIATGSTPVVYQLSSGNGVSAYSGDGVSGLYVWGAQFETGPNGHATSYIPTAGTSVTRAQDLATMPLTSLTGWDANQGGVATCTSRIYSRNQNASFDNPGLYFNQNGGSTNAIFLNPKNRSADTTYGGWSSSGPNGGSSRQVSTVPAEFTRFRMAVGWGSARSSTARGQTLVTGSGTFSLPTNAMNQLTFGSYFTTNLNGAIEQAAYFKGERYPTFVQRASQ